MLAERSEVDDDPIDTGWQFLCGAKSHDKVEDAEVWALDEVLELEPTLKNFMELPFGTRITRKDKSSTWKVSIS